jgi:hypothetical protein
MLRKCTYRKAAGGNEANRFFSDKYWRRALKSRFEGEHLVKLSTAGLVAGRCEQAVLSGVAKRSFRCENEGARRRKTRGSYISKESEQCKDC